jgi:hypothetical protein
MSSFVIDDSPNALGTSHMEPHLRFIGNKRRFAMRKSINKKAKISLPFVVAATLLASTSIVSAQEVGVSADVGGAVSADVGVGAGGVSASADVGGGASAGGVSADAAVGGSPGGGVGASADVGVGGNSALGGGVNANVGANVSGTSPTGANVNVGIGNQGLLGGLLGGTNANVNATIGGTNTAAINANAAIASSPGGTGLAPVNGIANATIGNAASATGTVNNNTPGGINVGLGAIIGGLFGATPGTPGTPGGTPGTPGGVAGLNASNIAGSFAMLPQREQARIARRCGSILKNPNAHDRESLAVCRVLAAR